MKPNASKPREDVLNAFAVEPDPSADTLDRYVREYPEYAVDLKELSQELLAPVTEATGPLSAEDTAFIDKAWKRHQAVALSVQADPFAAVTVSVLREVANTLGIRRSVLTAFRERKVIFSSVPQAFLLRLASALNTPADALTKFLKLSPNPQPAFSYKADQKPKESGPVTFEQLLIESGMPEAERAKLMASE
jgi:hypothetical protein